jgi:hypothetical protein
MHYDQKRTKQRREKRRRTEGRGEEKDIPEDQRSLDHYHYKLQGIKQARYPAVCPSHFRKSWSGCTRGRTLQIKTEKNTIKILVKIEGDGGRKKRWSEADLRLQGFGQGEGR